ncbi:MAG: hypothetical protein O7B23_07680, partial [Deltaproteobacteria bacterium]|nr:hypothetical protein [Deltaproteobacteria bacterium]
MRQIGPRAGRGTGNVFDNTEAHAQRCAQLRQTPRQSHPPHPRCGLPQRPGVLLDLLVDRGGERCGTEEALPNGPYR